MQLESIDIELKNFYLLENDLGIPASSSHSFITFSPQDIPLGCPHTNTVIFEKIKLDFISSMTISEGVKKMSLHF